VPIAAECAVIVDDEDCMDIIDDRARSSLSDNTNSTCAPDNAVDDLCHDIKTAPIASWSAGDKSRLLRDPPLDITVI
jgi:hypothetical protein